MQTIFHYLKKPAHGLLPFTCILCHGRSSQTLDLCCACQSELPILPQSCPRCAKIFSSTTLTCGTCLQNPPVFAATYALFSYLPPITKLLMEIKFHQLLVNARLMGELLASAIQQHWYIGQSLPDKIIPVPLHPQRLRERGFNQAVEIGRPIQKKTGIFLDINSCFRIKHTAAQATLKAEKRVDNLKNAFAINQDLTGQHIAILDDVITTGHTVTELSKTLKKAGAKRIDIWACARAQQ
jgi:ComF family protein